jgi:hypothetical protein
MSHLTTSFITLSAALICPAVLLWQACAEEE